MDPHRLLVQRTAILLLGLTRFALSQTCDERNYTLINDPRRNVSYYNASETPLCDKGLDEARWYRVSSSAGDTIVEREANDPVPTHHCGTHAPIYIRGLGSHPLYDFTTVNATVCGHYYDDACIWIGLISIHRCPVQGATSYYLYKLQSPSACYYAYCVGWLGSCNEGEYWNGVSCVPTTSQISIEPEPVTTPEIIPAVTTDWYQPPQPCTRSSAVYMDLGPKGDAYGLQRSSMIIPRGSPKCIVVCDKHCSASIVPSSLTSCTQSPCQHSGTCIQLSTGYRCQCRTGFTGTNCAQELDCDGVTCAERIASHG